MHSLNESLNRIIAAYSAESLREAGNRMISLLANHMDSVQTSQGNVLNWADPVDNILEAKRIADGFIDLSGSNKPAEQISKRFEQIVNEMLQRGHNLHDPRYVGHQVPAPVPLAGLFDAIGSVTNQVMAIYEMGPWSTAVEQAMCGKLAEYLGWKPGSFAGLVTHGGSLANLNGLLVARNVTMPNCWEDGVGTTASEVPPVLVVHSDAHYSIARSAGILGLGTKQVVKADLDSRRRMDSRRLDQTLSELKQKGHPIIAVVACACSTPIGSFDPLNDIADVCEKHSVWMHVDAAHGGSTLLSQQHRGLVAGLERADSLVWDAHKMMFVPALCAFLFFKKHRHS
ncbi:MAG: aminotransferase class I/II-fold pyridoxal phosphate-dependent enzyme, partial [Planctomycetes bacterium]|nr:aminotransferase class I/II-fold pyridoxal phosphate-dependent enzyme [Planctomycetota bacterium]